MLNYSNQHAIDLSRFRNNRFDRARPFWVEALWLITQALFVSSWLPGSGYRRLILKLFGASVGKNVVIKPRVRIKFPWQLVIGNNSWIGEDVWIDNLAFVTIGSSACISQGTYLCTGSHDWTSPTFDLVVKAIVIGDGAWVAAKSTVGPGVTVGEGAVLGLGGTALKDLDPWSIYIGTPAMFVRERFVKPATTL
jgi:putative colanic acid biosynthesis acetyltransferase WcaF